MRRSVADSAAIELQEQREREVVEIVEVACVQEKFDKVCDDDDCDPKNNKEYFDEGDEGIAVTKYREVLELPESDDEERDPLEVIYSDCSWSPYLLWSDCL